MNHRQEIIDIVMRIENLDYLEFIYNMIFYARSAADELDIFIKRICYISAESVQS